MKARIGTRQLTVTLVSLLLLLGVIGFIQSLIPTHTATRSSEVGFTSLSPRGTSGGAIVPASCESGYAHSYNECAEPYSFYLYASPDRVEYGTGTYLYWANSRIGMQDPDTGGQGYCILSGGEMPQQQFSSSDTRNGMVYASYLTSNTNFTLNCAYTTGPFWDSRSAMVYVNPPGACYPDPTPGNLGGDCTSPANACGQVNWGSIQCNSSCSATTPSNAGCAPGASLSANPTTIDSGQSSTLTWSSSNASSCTAAGGFSTGGAPSGSVSTGALTQTSNYQITCAGPGGTSAPSYATVTVVTPTVSITTSTNRVNIGTGGGGGGGGSGSVGVSWSAANVNACIITRNGATWQTLTADASRQVSGSSPDTITTQTIYMISCTNNAGGSATAATATRIVNVVSGFQEF